MADHLFENQTITSEGLNLIAHATATDAIVYTKALSNATVPADPSNVSSYSGKVGTIASASSSGSAARITLAFENSDTTSPQAVKCVALMGRLQSESGDGIIVAYCSSGESSITLPSSLDAPCVTRFVVNLVMSAGSDSTINVVESGVASLSDLSRFVSLHVAGDPTTGEVQVIRGAKTFADQATFNSLVVAENGLTSNKDLNITRMNVLDNDSSVLGSLGNGGGGKVVLSMKKSYPIFISNSNATVNVSGSSINFTASSGGVNLSGDSINLTAQSGGINVDGRLLPVQEYSWLGDSDHVWFYAHINELTAEEVTASAYGGAATQIKSDRVNGIYLSDSSGANMSSISPKDLSDIIVNKAFAMVGHNSRVGVGEICYIDLTRGPDDVRNVSFTIPRGTTVGTGVTYSASSNTFHLRALRQGSSWLLADGYRFVILSSAVMPAVGASQTADNVRTTVLAACVNGD